VHLVENILPRLRGEAEATSRGPSRSSAHHENPHPLDVEAPRTEETPALPVPSASLPVSETTDQPVFSGCWSMTYSPERTLPTAPTTVTMDPPPEQPSVPTAPLPTWEDFLKNDFPSIAAAAQEISAEEEQIEVPEHPSDYDFQFSYGGNTGISPPTYQDIQRSLSPLPDSLGQSIELGSEENTNETGTAPGDLAGFDFGVLDEEWDRFFAFSDSA